MLIYFVLLLATGELGSALYSHSSPETSGSSDGPMTQHKKVRCFSENVKKGDDRNYEIEQIRKKEDVRESVVRSGRSADCIVETQVTRGNKVTNSGFRPPEDHMDIEHDTPHIPADITDLGKFDTGGFDTPNIPISIHEFDNTGGGGGGGGGYDIPNKPPVLINDYGSVNKQEYGEETEKSYGSSTSMRRQESFDRQEYSREKTRTMPGGRSGWGGGDASDDPSWKIKYDTSANEINEINEANDINRCGNVTGNLLVAFLLEMFLVYVIQ